MEMKEVVRHNIHSQANVIDEVSEEYQHTENAFVKLSEFSPRA
jgi:hypothetical protein